MTNAPAADGPQVVTPERQIAAAQNGSIFESMHAYLRTLQHTNEQGQLLTTTPLEYARKALEEASFWSIKHILLHGMPPAPKPAANDDSAVPPPEAPPLPTDNAAGTEPV